MLLFTYFIFQQAEYFRNAVLSIEGNTVSAIDVAHHLDTLRANILLRKVEKYLDPETEAEVENVTTKNNFDRGMIEGVFADFLGSPILSFDFLS